MCACKCVLMNVCMYVGVVEGYNVTVFSLDCGPQTLNALRDQLVPSSNWIPSKDLQVFLGPMNPCNADRNSSLS